MTRRSTVYLRPIEAEPKRTDNGCAALFVMFILGFVGGVVVAWGGGM